MCEPVTISTTALWVMGSMAAVGAAAAYAQSESAAKTAKAQAKATGQANQIQADQIAQQAGAKMMQESRGARRAVGEARVSASESGINLGSNSFLAVLQNSAFNENFDNGLVAVNNENQQAARQSQYSSRLASIHIPTTLGIGLNTMSGAMSGAQSGLSAYNSGVNAGGAG